MELEFLRTFWAIEEVLKFYKDFSVRDHANRLAGKPNLEYLAGKDQHVISLINLMEGEIKQALFTLIPAAQIELLELLSAWLTDWRIVEVNEPLIYQTAELYNYEKEPEYLKNLEEKVSEFINTEEYKTLSHLQEYDVTHKSGGLHALHLKSSFTWTEKKTYHRFYCNFLERDEVNIDFIPHYIEYITPVVDAFRRMLTKYVSRYKEGKMAFQMVSGYVPLLPPPPPQSPIKLPAAHKFQTSLSVPELAALFRLMKDVGVLKITNQKEFARFVSESFETPGATDISSDSFNKKMSSPEAKSMKGLVSVLRKMFDSAAKF